MTIRKGGWPRVAMALLAVALTCLFVSDVAWAEEWGGGIDAASTFSAPPAIDEGRCRKPAEDAEAEEDLESAALGATDGAEPDGAPYQWIRIAGDNARKTMRKIVQTEGVFTPEETRAVMVATEANYKDALACAGYAGMVGAPILITNGTSLSAETRDEIRRLQPEWIGIVGGNKVITTNVEDQLKELCGNVERACGPNAVSTSVQLYKSAPADQWDYYAIVATGDGYKDALSIAPFAYWAWSPIFLANSNKKDPDKRILSDEVLDCLKNGGFSKVIIVGGPKAVSSKVEGQLRDIGLSYKRVAGSNGIDTSRAVAQFALREGMGMKHMTVATTSGYKDALCAVPLCGEQGSVLTLCNTTGGLDAFNAVYDSDKVGHGHVVGGVKAISESNYTAITSHE